ncbi:leucine-rich repeat protein [Ceratobasidium sp. AG-Ba]|nr:leucine-rich repeat protein [Ceratobasidium sp. AG-Ba]
MGGDIALKGEQGDTVLHSSRALQIWEIRNAIALCVDYTDAISLLYVSQAFFYVAIRKVWGSRVVDAQDLLNLLGGFEFTNQSRLMTLQLNIPKPLPSGYFDRFRIYASHVREIDYSLSQPTVDTYLDEFYYHSEEIRALTSAIGETVLMPHLDHIRLGRRFRTLRPMYDLRLLGLLISPSLAQLTLVENVSIDRSQYQSFFQFLGARILTGCPELRSLSMRDENRSLPIPQCLSTLAVDSDILNSELLVWISRMPGLKTLTIGNIMNHNAAMFSQAVFPGGAFQNLRTLFLTGCEGRPLMGLWTTSLVSQVEEVEISLLTYEDVPLYPLYYLFATRSRQMRSLRVVLDIARYSERGVLTFEPDQLDCTPQTNLIEFVLDGIEVEGINPASAIARTWPSLRHLELNHFIELDDFLQLPVLLPNLEYLRVTGPEALGEPSELERILEEGGIRQSFVISALEFETFPLVTAARPSVCDPIARFFAQWWPRMRLLPPRYIMEEREEGWAEACAYINKRILDFSEKST